MKTPVTYAAITEHAFSDSAASPNYLVCLSMAQKLDYLRREIRDSAAQMARRFGDYVADMDSPGFASPLTVREPPTGWSNLDQLTKDAAKFDALVSAFKETFEALSGATFVRAKKSFDAATADADHASEP